MDDNPLPRIGCVILIVIILGIFLGPTLNRFYEDSQDQQFQCELSGVVRQPLFSSPVFVVIIHHQNPGVIHNGTLTVTVKSDSLGGNKKEQSKSHSFEAWMPNEDNAVELSFPLSEHDDDTTIEVLIAFNAKKVKPYASRSEWVGNKWVEMF